jgi:Tfp pilus assembly protein FimT
MLELTVVMTIVAIVSSMFMGRVHELLIAGRMTRAATTMQNDLESAFAIAGRNRRPVRIAWDASRLQLDITDRSGTVFYRRVALGTAVYGLTSSGISVSRSPVEVYPNGLANDTLTITLSSNNITKRIRVSRAGLVRVE